MKLALLEVCKWSLIDRPYGNLVRKQYARILIAAKENKNKWFCLGYIKEESHLKQYL